MEKETEEIIEEYIDTEEIIYVCDNCGSDTLGNPWDCMYCGDNHLHEEIRRGRKRKE